MSSARNRHGLARKIPGDVRREVRRQCHFGCVVCGRSFIQYDHLDPEFKDAVLHVAEGIALLCGGCHDEKTCGRLSLQTVQHFRANPKARELGHSWYRDQNVALAHPEIHFGGMVLKRCPTPIAVRGEPLISIEGPEADGAPFRLSATFCDLNGNVTLCIAENEWQATTHAWDAETEGTTLTIRERKGVQLLRLRALPGVGIAVERLQMSLHGYTFDGDEKQVTITQPDGGRGQFIGGMADNCRVGLSFR